jgi:hypothetical protein
MISLIKGEKMKNKLTNILSLAPRVLAVGLISLLLVVPAFATYGAGAPTTTLGVRPEVVENNPSCSDEFSGYLFEYKFEPVEDAVVPLSWMGLNFDLTIDVDEGAKTFDFSFSNGFGVNGILVKGGPDANVYDYGDGATSDTGLHAPEQSPGKYYGLSHISFCIVQLETALTIEKTAVDEYITIGDKFAYDITVSDVADGIDAINVTVDDALVPDGFDWTITAQDGTACSISDDDLDGYIDDLSCTFATLADGDSYSLTVETVTSATAALCDMTYTNWAYADADNADPVSDDASITVQCGGLKVVKTAKHADSSGATYANLAATFRITDFNDETYDVTTDATTGEFCQDDLPLGDATVEEIDGPDGYQKDPDVETVTVTDADCPSPGAGATASFENIPLTDIYWEVDSQHDGATSTHVYCVDGDGNVLVDTTVSDGSGSFLNLLPTAPGVTVSCDFTVDP